MDLGDLEEEVNAVRANTVAKESRKAYQYSVTKFIQWLFLYKRNLICDEFAESLDVVDGVPLTHSIQQLIEQRVPPLHFDRLTARDFVTWLVSLKKRNGDKPGYSTFNGHRAALFNLFRDFEQTMSQSLSSELGCHFKGLKRTIASAAARAKVSHKTGKDPLPFGLYRSFGMHMLKQVNREMIFARAFLLLCWNLMCRSHNAFGVYFPHMSMFEDSLCIQFSQMKNDQFGERPKDPRHIYANPIMPEICPILGLCIYFLSFNLQSDQQKLFPGNNQYERFRKLLTRTLESEELDHEMRHLGIENADIGSHSIRKGAATFCSSGSTACPPSTAIHLRAGWALGGVQDTYLRYEAAGDQYVGRTVSGLPLNSVEFAILPPHFSDNKNRYVLEAFSLCFPEVPPQRNLIGVLLSTLASVVYHHRFLIQTLPERHCLFQSALFRRMDLMPHLMELVVCGLPNVQHRISPTGLPPHTSLLLKMQLVADRVGENILNQENNVQRVISGIIEELEERAVGAGTVTRDGLVDTIKKCLSDAGVTELLSEISSGRQIRSGHIPNPFRRLVPSDMSSTNKKKRLSDYRFLMLRVEREALSSTDANCFRRTLDESEAIMIWQQYQGVIAYVSSTLVICLINSYHMSPVEYTT